MHKDGTSHGGQIRRGQRVSRYHTGHFTSRSMWYRRCLGDSQRTHSVSACLKRNIISTSAAAQEGMLRRSRCIQIFL